MRLKRLLVPAIILAATCLAVGFGLTFTPHSAPLSVSASSNSWTPLSNGNGNGGTQFEVNHIPVETVEILNLGKTVLTPGESTQLSFKLTPHFAIYTIKSVNFNITQGAELATIENGLLTINTGIQVGGDVIIRATIDGVPSFNFIIVAVDVEGTIPGFVPVNEVILGLAPLRPRAQVTEGDNLRIRDVVSYTILPTNSTQRFVNRFEVTRNRHLAWVEGDRIRIHSDVPSGHLTFGITAWAFGVPSEEFTIEIFVPARGIILTPSNLNPTSRMNSSDSVTLTARPTNISATNQNPVITIDSQSAELINPADLLNGQLRSNTFRVRQGLTNVITTHRAIVVTASQDNRSTTEAINIYVPIETIAVANGTFQRGQTTNFTMVINGGVNTFVTHYSWNAEITNETQVPTAILTRLTDRRVSVWMPANTGAGARIDVDFWMLNSANQRVSETSAHFTVASIVTNTTTVMSYTGAPASNSGGFVFGLTNDNTGVTILQSYNQLMTGRNADISVMRNNISLAAQGLSIDSVQLSIRNRSTGALIAGNAPASWGLTSTGFNLGIGLTANGQQDIGFIVMIRDGNYTFPLTLQRMRVFRPMGGEITQSHTTINDRFTTITFSAGSGWVTTSTFGLGNLRLEPISLGGSVDNQGRFEVLAGADLRQYVNVVFPQRYNGTEPASLRFSRQIILNLRTINVNRHQGTGGVDSVMAVNGVATGVAAHDRPIRTGFNFAGFYSTQSGAGTRLINADGTHNSSNWAGVAQAHARWNPITYTIRLEAGHFRRVQGPIYLSEPIGIEPSFVIIPPGIFPPGGGHSYVWTRLNNSFNQDITMTFTEQRTFNRPSISGFSFDRWNTSCTRNGRTQSDITVSQLTSVEGNVIVIRAVFTENSCVAEGTLITLADGSQVPVEELTGDELLLVWNFKTGSFDFAPIIFIDSDPRQDFEIIHLFFSDGNGTESDVKVIFEHAFWNFDLNRFVFFRNYNATDYLNHWFKKHIPDGNGGMTWTKLQLVEVEIYWKVTTAWSPVTFSHLSFYVNGMLSMPGMTQGLIDIFKVIPELMQICHDSYLADIEKFGLMCWERDFKELGVPIEIFWAFNGQYLGVSMGKGLITMERLLELIVHYSQFF